MKRLLISSLAVVTVLAFGAGGVSAAETYDAGADLVTAETAG